MGAPINTPFDEDAPYIHPNGKPCIFLLMDTDLWVDMTFSAPVGTEVNGVSP